MKQYLKSTAIFVAVSVVVFALLMGLISAGVIDNYYTQILVTICINVIMALSANLIINYTGQLTLGHTAFMAIGAYAAAMFAMKVHLPLLLSLAVSLIFGGLVAALFGFLIGLPTLRLKGDYLAITTLGFCQIIVVVIQNIPALGGAQGLTNIPSIPMNDKFIWTFFVMIITIFLLYNLVRSNQGRSMVAVREDEIAAEAMGVNTTRYKIMAFTVGAFFAGVAGGLFAYLNMFIEPNMFNFLNSINYVIYVVLGGTGNFVGCIASTSVLTLLPEALRQFGDLRMVIYPLLLIIIMIARVKKVNPARLFGLLSGVVKKANRNGRDTNAAA